MKHVLLQYSGKSKEKAGLSGDSHNMPA